ncbi:unnamed protein product [Rotaria sordida]|uniref:Uncharacterized protein n=1 Tax=Rotaria sordida TaxID=392033 RepID=A0A815JKS2_9BILA|nr:unnamed protein product [Rotaria sordida]CAF1380982.1 unnamed protein product [Rotaria sordida]CAF3770606.1 unnamed protein product [Rotaria sordida]CAF3953012.1 unnamed protein product [Rotaria sordida]
MDILFPNLDSTQLLLEYGKRWIDVDAKDQDRGDTALHIVSRNFRKNVQGTATNIIELLLDAGTHIDYVNNYGKTPLDQSSGIGIRTLLRSKQTPSRLKCLCAHLINIHQIPYDHIWPNPTALTTFVQLHDQPSSEDDDLDFGLFD